jgi:hypothetical protein
MTAFNAVLARLTRICQRSVAPHFRPRKYEKVDEFLTKVLLHAWTFRRVHQHHAILIKEASVALDSDSEIASILKGKPRAAIRQT